MSKAKLHTAVWRCVYCGTESIQVGTDSGSSGTQCPRGCPGNFRLVKEYPLATSLKGITEAFNEIERRNLKQDNAVDVLSSASLCPKHH